MTTMKLVLVTLTLASLAWLSQAEVKSILDNVCSHGNTSCQIRAYACMQIMHNDLDNTMEHHHAGHKEGLKTMVEEHHAGHNEGLKTLVEEHHAGHNEGLKTLVEEAIANLTLCASMLNISLPILNDTSYEHHNHNSPLAIMNAIEVTNPSGATNLRQCFLLKRGVLVPSTTNPNVYQIDRNGMMARVSAALEKHHNAQVAVVSALGSCPEPANYQILDYFKCVAITCINTITMS